MSHGHHVLAARLGYHLEETASFSLLSLQLTGSQQLLGG